jgi:hypothetical protein
LRPLFFCPLTNSLQTRQELCESLPYYRAYQSGCYGFGDTIRGYLLDGTDSPRDFVGGKVFVSHSGGKSEEDVPSGTRKLKADQTLDDTTVRYLVNNMTRHFPVAVIIGKSAQ